MRLNVTLISLAFALVSYAIPLKSVSSESDIISKAQDGSPSPPSRNDSYPTTYEALSKRGQCCAPSTRHSDPEDSRLLPQTHPERNSLATGNVIYTFCSPSDPDTGKCDPQINKGIDLAVNYAMKLLVKELMTAIWSNHPGIPSDHRGIRVDAEPWDSCPYNFVDLFTKGSTIHLHNAPYPFTGDGVVTLVPDEKPKTFKVKVVVAMITQKKKKLASTLGFELSESLINEIKKVNHLEVSYGFCSPSETRANRCDKGKEPDTAEEADEAGRLAEVDKTMRDLSQGLIYEMYAHNPESPSHQAWMQVLPRPQDRFPSPITAADLYEDGTKIYLHDAPFIGNALVRIEPVPFTRKFSVSVYKAKGKKEGAFSKKSSFTFSFEPSHAVVDWDPSTVLVADSD
ncbi:hypothetical protein F5878DRAFT_728181 [Lentinula raphanica]|uniref:Uncharacterized protein n=1 Tax=Lentinula raphanica TaxID=153919 RepID=A0AA38P1D0_9AGAR|nr:hypothetical protein F5878DRAFT_728181 [Lentinula raphanica]